MSLREMAEIVYLTNHWVFSPHFFCNDILLKQGLQTTKKLSNLDLLMVQNEDLVMKISFYAAADQARAL